MHPTYHSHQSTCAHKTAQLSLRLLLFSLLACIQVNQRCKAAEPYTKTIAPFVERYCLECHNSTKTKGQLDLTTFSSAEDIAKHYRHWQNIVDFIREGEMPPEKYKRQPTAQEQQNLLTAIDDILVTAAAKKAGDPGIVLARRLSNTEYDTVIKDITGVDIRPTRSFPVDPSSGEGFQNTGEALTMSAPLLSKYIEAAEQVAHHLYITSQGVQFAPQPMHTRANRSRYAEAQIMHFYKQHVPDQQRHLLELWLYSKRPASQKDISLNQWAKRYGLSLSYFTLLTKAFSKDATSLPQDPFLGPLIIHWQRLPEPDPKRLKAYRSRGKKGDLNYHLLPKPMQDLLGQLLSIKHALHPAEAMTFTTRYGYPPSHFKKRQAIADSRNRFRSEKLLQDQVQVHIGSVPHKKHLKNKDSINLSLQLRTYPENQKTAMVLLKNLRFYKEFTSTGQAKQPGSGLGDVLKKYDAKQHAQLGFATTRNGQQLGPNDLLVPAPGKLLITLPRSALHKSQKPHLVATIQLLDRESCIVLNRKPNLGKRWPKALPVLDSARFICHPDSAIGQKLSHSGTRFCSLFPSTFAHWSSEYGLGSGLRHFDGVFRDDLPLYQQLLNPEQQQELDQLWQQHHFITTQHRHLLKELVTREKVGMRPRLKGKAWTYLDVDPSRFMTAAVQDRFEQDYLALFASTSSKAADQERAHKRIAMIKAWIDQSRQGHAAYLEALQRIGPAAQQQVLALIEKAFRRPLHADELQAFKKLFVTQMANNSENLEQALRAMLSAGLLSPAFLYRYVPQHSQGEVAPLSAQALAERLSFWLWSSIPDAQLSKYIHDNRLLDERVLRQETKRMLQSDRIDVFARSFFGQWLRYGDFLDNDPVSKEAFRDYTDSVRRAMLEEPSRLLAWLIQQDRPVTDLLTSDTTFVNRRLATHYGRQISGLYDKARAKQSPPSDWQRISGIRRQGRGGLFGMAVILARNAAGERTSPVKRGYWTVHHLLGQHFPPAPDDVPELPEREKDAKKTMRELLALHAAAPDCAICHQRFDHFGLALEGFDPTGKERHRDLGGRRIDTSVTYPDGSTGHGIAGLIDYVDGKRRDEFIDHLCQKFLGYALGRSVQLSDRPLLQRMHKELKQSNYRFSQLFMTVVTSSQFTSHRHHSH